MKNFYYKFVFLVKTLLRLVFLLFQNGNHCCICGKKTILAPLCKQCKKNVFYFDKTVKRCECCGKELLTSQKICMECREKTVNEHLDSVIPVFSYRLWNKELLYAWKMKGERSLSFVFAQLVNDVLKDLEYDAIVPVPPRPGKIKENGWDQIDELVNLLEFYFGKKVVRLLERNFNYQQKKLDREERLETIDKGYSLINELNFDKENSIPQTVCLIDDVTTTGATLESCGRLLKEAGVQKVIAITLFIVD